MRTLIFGAKGQLGRDLVSVFQAEGTILGVDLPEVDISDAAQVQGLVTDWRPDLIINAAAYTDVEKAEDEPVQAFRVNETGARNVARAAAASDVPVVYYSTDFVFGGLARRPYEPDDPVAPRGVYAESKAAGEAAVRTEAARHFIIRTAWLYGPGGNNFVEKILRAAATRPSLKVVDDEVGSPTHTFDLAEATLALARTTAYGTHHAVNGGVCSRYEFATAIVSAAGLTTAIAPCRAVEFPSKAPRPAYSALSTEKLKAATGYTMRSWQEALRHYMKRRETLS